MSGGRGGISSFSVLLIAVALAAVGIVSIPRLNVQYKPSEPGHTIRVSYRLAGASSESLESEVTSKIEGVLAGLDGCRKVTSVSSKGVGSVSVTFGKNTDIAAARFEVASAVRNIYPSLPEGLTYPSISLNAGGEKKTPAISYQVKSPLPSVEIEKFIKNHIQTPLSSVKGVEDIRISGVSPYQWVITFDAGKLVSLGMKAADISSAFRNHYSERLLGMTELPGGNVMGVRLAPSSGDDFGAIPVRKVAGRVVYLRDIATWRYEESLPDTYFRINGLNTIGVTVYTSGGSSMLTAVRGVKEMMSSMQDGFPSEFTVSEGYDATGYVTSELNKIYVRTGLCILILLLFVFLVNRSWRSLFIVMLTLGVNVLISLAVYSFAGIPVHIYTLAGITVSLGIVIDTTIVMTGHYEYYRDRGAFPELLAAVLTTVASLIMILLLPESERGNLTDFIWVISINLCVSLAVAYFFVPALMDYLPVRRTSYSLSMRRRRRVVRWNHTYERVLRWSVRHRAAFVVALIMAFGIPLFMIPAPSKKTRGAFYEKIVRPVVSWQPYVKARNNIDRYAGSSFGLFYRALDRSNFYREPERKKLYISPGMPEGCSVQQLNEVTRSMENYLSSFDEIEMFTTSINSYDDAMIVVTFKPEYENTSFASALKSQVTSMAINFGGANWQVYGIDENSFNNNIISTRRSDRIALQGYNFKELCRYAEILMDTMASYKRVQGLEIWGAGRNGEPSTEFVLDYDFEKMLSAGVNPYNYYRKLSTLLFDSRICAVPGDDGPVQVLLRSSDSDSYDLWHVLNEPVEVDSVKAKLSVAGSIVKKRTGLDIRKKNQSYEINVCYDFIGSRELSMSLKRNMTDYMNEEVLPVGFKAEFSGGGWFERHKDRYAWLILLIIAVIYVMLAMSFESLKLPFAVILMIPVSFIGLFLAFGLSELTFDQGGFAAFVMLCGIVVNAGIYLVRTYQKTAGPNRLRCYVKAFNHKVNPILLTILSTILGLLPFLSDGPEEVFWFDFAVGTISGLLFSMIAMYFYLPIFVLSRREKVE